MPELPSHAQVVIIGGGVGGCSIAYHLTKMGWKDVVVLERHELTAGSTWHSAGLVGQLRSDANLTRMMYYSTDLYSRLKEATGQDTGWRAVGGLRLASSAERLQELKRQVGMARSFGMPMELLTPREALELFPIMDIKGVVGAAYTPNDGMIDPTGLTNALAVGARSCGARFFMETDVEAIRVKSGRVEAVVTNRGTIQTEIVVNATGQWGGEVGRMVGLNLPVVPMAHLYQAHPRGRARLSHAARSGPARVLARGGGWADNRRIRAQSRAFRIKRHSKRLQVPAPAARLGAI
jgi:4-methylaminobutanoate oxidase (formaldehyde-forming)